MPNVAELIRDHVILTVECVDRLYLNAYVPRLQSEGGVIGFLRAAGPADPLAGAVRADHADVQGRSCGPGAGSGTSPGWSSRRASARTTSSSRTDGASSIGPGWCWSGVAQERATGWRGIKRVEGERIHFDYRRTSVYVAHYYVYFVDEEWGPGFLKICGYAPYTLKLCLNGHEWAKRQLTRAGIAFTALDNGFERCADPAALQAICDRLGADDIQACLDRWLRVAAAAADPGGRHGRLRLRPLDPATGGQPHPGVRPGPARAGAVRGGHPRAPRPGPTGSDPAAVRPQGHRHDPGPVLDPGRHPRRAAQSARRVQALPRQAVLQGGARPAHRDHLQRYLRRRASRVV